MFVRIATGLFSIMLVSYAGPVAAQHDHHDFDGPALPPMLPVDIPSIPQAVLNDLEIPESPNVSDFSKKASEMTPMERSYRINEIEEEIRKLNGSIASLQKKASDPALISGSKEEAEAILLSRRNYELYYLALAETRKGDLAGIDETDPLASMQREAYQGSLDNIYKSLAQNSEQIAYWENEVSVRSPVSDGFAQQIEDKKNAVDLLTQELAALKENRPPPGQGWTPLAGASDNDGAGEPSQAGEADGGDFSASDIGADDFFSGDPVGVAGFTTNVTPNKTMQELREDDLRKAFGEMHSLEFQTGVLQTADIAGQATQLVIGFVPGATVADVGLSTARGFAEALGEEIAKGTSWDDALKIASVNAGMKGAVSFVGNKLTAGADKMGNRVAVLSEVGFSKLSTKQVAEMGAQGISFVVVKSGQAVGQTVTEEAVGKPAVKKVADWVKSGKNTTSTSKSSSSPSFGGYGTSTSTQPLVNY